MIGSPGGRGKVHQVADPAQVLVEDLLGVGQVDVGLLGAADAEDVAALGEGIRLDGGVLAGGPQEPRGRRAAAAPAIRACPLSVASRAAASSQDARSFLQNANRSRLRVRSAPSGWQKTGTGMAATPTRAGSRRARSTESVMPSGRGVDVDEVRALRGEDVEARRRGGLR